MKLSASDFFRLLRYRILSHVTSGSRKKKYKYKYKNMLASLERNSRAMIRMEDLSCQEREVYFMLKQVQESKRG